MAAMGSLPCQARSFSSIHRSKLASNVRNLRLCQSRPVHPTRLPQTTLASSAVAYPSQDPRSSYAPLQRLCKNVLVGVAAAATWSVLASTVTGPSTPFASLTMTGPNSGASGKFIATLQMHAYMVSVQSFSQTVHDCCRCCSSSQKCVGWTRSWFPTHALWTRSSSSK